MKLYSAIWGDFHPLSVFFPEAPTKVVNDPEDFEGPGILILHGGQDIAPSLYKKGRSRWSGADTHPSARDLIEWALMKEAIKQKILIFGICRGFQMICAKAGGFLYQDVDNHAYGNHQITTNKDERFVVNSMHHQMVAPWDVKHELLAVSEPLTTTVYDVDNVVQPEVEVESAYFPDIHAFGVQWHPECMPAKCPAGKWIEKEVNRLWQS